MHFHTLEDLSSYPSCCSRYTIDGKKQMSKDIDYILILIVGQGGQPLSLGYIKHWGVCYTHFSILFSLILVVFSVYDE